LKARIAVLASGVGTNLSALLDDAVVGPQVALVISDRSDAGALERARDRDVPAQFIDPSAAPNQEGYDRLLLGILRTSDIEFLALAGFMRILGPELVEAYEGRILNVHPSLLPAFQGDRSVARALEWGVKTTGVTVHLVDEKVDHGPIVSQEAVAVALDDDWDSLEARIHEVEHRLFPAAVRALVEGRLKVEGRRVHVLENGGLP
jgi:phosphoribosylglycinamide formyltransferase-1